MQTGKIFLIILIMLSVVGCGEKNVKQPNQTQPAAHKELSFKRVSADEIPETKPQIGWSDVKTIDLGMIDGKPISFLFYSKNIEDAESEVQALFHYEGKLYDYELGIIPYRLSEVEANKVNGSFDDKVVLAGIGTTLTHWNVIMLDKKTQKLLSFRTVGRPEMIDLDFDGHKELVASFEGAHLNFPNVVIFRYKNGEMESAQVIESKNSEDPEYARLVKQGSDYVIEIGKVREEIPPQRYKYESGRLVKIL
jgi:hypothetical protein